MTETIEVSQKNGVVLIRLNRPKQLNALNGRIAQEILSTLADFDNDPSVGCFVLTGNEKAFAAGADIMEMSELTYEEMAARDFFVEWEAFAKFRTPKIAAVNGYALGGGCELMMMCDFAIAGKGAKFAQPEIKLGVIPGLGGTQRMTRLVGRSLSMDMHLTGRMMNAEEALRAGLVARVVPDGDVVNAALDAAQTIASFSRPTAALVRDAVNRADEVGLNEGLFFERRIFHSLFGTQDQKEGMSAFLEKREPDFNRS
ncbi:enoyl-CoA hydratase-related protein [Litoreibacter sp.]|nr:enoyl-CoA hydratase-related protein [Litoreibacter sp.]